MMDKDLAELYGVKPIRLREQVKRNLTRFPKDFMFQLNDEETEWLLSQFAIASRKHLGGFNPYVFTEQGVAMLSTVLNSERAIQANIAIIRAFVKIRQISLTHKDIEQKLGELEQKTKYHDAQIRNIFEAIKQLMQPPEKPKRQIGFRVEEPKQKYSVRRKR